MAGGEREEGFWVLVAIGLLTALCATLALVPATGLFGKSATATSHQPQNITHEGGQASTTHNSPQNTQPETAGPTAGAVSTTSTVPATSEAPGKTTLEREEPPAATGESAGWVMAVGDSAMLGAMEAMGQQIPGLALVDAQGSRQVAATIDLLGQYRSYDHLTDVVVLHVGNNGPITASDFDRMMSTLEGASKVLVVNLTVPPGVATPVAVPNNAVLADGGGRHAEKAVLVDWRAASEGHPEYFWDGIHLTPEGAAAYAALINSHLEAPAEGSAGPARAKEAYYWGEGGLSGQCVGPPAWCRSVVRP